jgi:nitronate monooxygenase
MGFLRKLRVPMVVAPMAGISNPKFVMGSSRAGALGSFGFAYTAPEKVASDVRQVLKENLPLNANFFIFHPVEESVLDQSELVESLEILKTRLPEPYSQVVEIPEAPYFPDLDTQLEAIWETKPPCLSFHFGIPQERVVERAKSLGITVGMTATSVQEAQQVARAGADYVVLQGIEAGGHRGTFIPNDPNDEQLSTLRLLTRVRSRLQSSHPTLQIVVSGGIMTKPVIREALSLGATAVQVGTLFIPSQESSASLEYKNAILGSPSPSSATFQDPSFPRTAYTTSWSGRRAQCLQNSFLDHLLPRSAQQPHKPLPFPLQNTATLRIREIAKNRRDAQFQSLYAGSNYAKCREVLYDGDSVDDIARWKREEELLSVEQIIHKLTSSVF